MAQRPAQHGRRVAKKVERLMYIAAQQEQFSKAFVRAIAAVAGCNVTACEVDDDSIDLGLAANRSFGIDARAPRLDLQLKCLSTDDGQGARLPYDVKKKNYDDLRDPTVHVPRVLVVCCVPQEVSDWLHETPEATAMRRCAYWLSLRGMPPTENAVKCRLHIPPAHSACATVHR
jgi:hypothetical protein